MKKTYLHGQFIACTQNIHWKACTIRNYHYLLLVTFKSDCYLGHVLLEFQLLALLNTKINSRKYTLMLTLTWLLILPGIPLISFSTVTNFRLLSFINISFTEINKLCNREFSICQGYEWAWTKSFWSKTS